MANCTEENCDGVLREDSSIELPNGCRSYDWACPCSKCGRLHWRDGDPLFDRRDNKIFLKTGVYNCLVRRDAEGNIVSVDRLNRGSCRPFPSPMSKMANTTSESEVIT